MQKRVAQAYAFLK